MALAELEIHNRAPTTNEWEAMTRIAREALEIVLGTERAKAEIALYKLYLLDTNQHGPTWFETWTMPNEDLVHFYYQKTVIGAARMDRKSPVLDKEEQKVVDEFGTRLKSAGLLFSYVPNNPRGFHRVK